MNDQNYSKRQVENDAKRRPEKKPVRPITVALTEEEHTRLETLARVRTGAGAKTLLRCIVGDLIDSEWTGGSDERMYARQWLDRRFGREWYGRELSARGKARKPGKAASPPSDEIPDYFDQLLAGKGGQL